MPHGQEEYAEVKRSLTVAEVGVIISMLLSLASLLFTAGIIYGDVQRATQRIAALEPKVETLSMRIERIDANVQFLTERAREREQRR